MPSALRLTRIGDRFKVDRELSYAEIYVSAVEGVSRSKEVLQGLESASGFIRKVLSERVELRSFPRLRFHWDVTPERADRIEQLLAAIHTEEGQRKKKR